VHSASRVILATPRTLYRAFLDRETVTAWRAPEAMRAELFAFDPRIGGGYRMALHRIETIGAGADPSLGQGTKIVGKFLELLPEQKIVERLRFESADRAGARPMTITTSFLAMRDGTKVTMLCEDIPAAMAAADLETGLANGLRRLALLTE
jgi:uncharacterized protein YndB with AHSA1/START domain